MMDCASNGLSIAKQNKTGLRGKIMRTRLRHGFAVATLTIICMLMGVFTSFADNSNGEMDPITGSVISGWAVDTDNPDKSASVVLYVYTDGTTGGKGTCQSDSRPIP